MSSRHKARKAAVDLLYRADLLGYDLADGLDDPSLREYTVALVQGVKDNLPYIDTALINALSSAATLDADGDPAGWTLDRLSYLDRAIARLAVYELRFTDLEPGIALSEAITLADELSADTSPRFLNGVLAAIS
ncbi:MAG: transcription antitermination protein NusB [Propionibacteriaceae bacterium]|nr:transcription antitermination protein NusB [Propionibacteriaceae bacterium]